MTTFLFTIKLTGTGDTLDKAWEDAKDAAIDAIQRVLL